MQGSAGQRFQVRTIIRSLSVIALLATNVVAQDEVPILALDAHGHTAVVNKVVFTPDGKEVITVADDKTIRFWQRNCWNSCGPGA